MKISLPPRILALSLSLTLALPPSVLPLPPSGGEGPGEGGAPFSTLRNLEIQQHTAVLEDLESRLREEQTAGLEEIPSQDRFLLRTVSNSNAPLDERLDAMDALGSRQRLQQFPRASRQWEPYVSILGEVMLRDADPKLRERIAYFLSETGHPDALRWYRDILSRPEETPLALRELMSFYITSLQFQNEGQLNEVERLLSKAARNPLQGDRVQEAAQEDLEEIRFIYGLARRLWNQAGEASDRAEALATAVAWMRTGPATPPAPKDTSAPEILRSFKEQFFRGEPGDYFLTYYWVLEQALSRETDAGLARAIHRHLLDLIQLTGMDSRLGLDTISIEPIWRSVRKRFELSEDPQAPALVAELDQALAWWADLSSPPAAGLEGAGKARREKGIPANQVQVLVVDDYPGVAELYVAYIEAGAASSPGTFDLENQVHMARDLPTALRIIAEKSPHVVFTDLNLSPRGKEGLAIARAAKKKNPSARVVLVSYPVNDEVLAVQKSINERELDELVEKGDNGSKLKDAIHRHLFSRLTGDAAGLEGEKPGRGTGDRGRAIRDTLPAPDVQAFLRGALGANFRPSGVQHWQSHIFDPANADVGRLAAELLKEPVVIIARDAGHAQQLQASGFAVDERPDRKILNLEDEAFGGDIKRARERARQLFAPWFDPQYYRTEDRPRLLLTLWLPELLKQYNIPDSVLSLRKAEGMLRALAALRAA